MTLRIVSLFFFLLIYYNPCAVAQPINAERPIPVRSTAFIEEMTWMEVRDAIASGKKTVLVPTGGVEQNGPYVSLGKHNYIVQEVSKRIAERLGTALVAPVVKFVPEGSIEPPSGHMQYPGTLSVESNTFKRLLEDICRSLRNHGFENIVLLGDSGGNQQPMKHVAEQLTQQWNTDKTRVFYVPEFYNYQEIAVLLDQLSLRQVSEAVHDDLAFTAQLMAIDPSLVRMDERIAVGKFEVNGISLQPPQKFIDLGERILELRVEKTVAAIVLRLSKGTEVPPAQRVHYGEEVVPLTGNEQFVDIVVAPFLYFINPQQRIYWVYLGTALLLAMVGYMYYRTREQPLSVRAFLAYCFPKSIYFHPSAKMDYGYFISNRILVPLLLSPVLFSAEVVSQGLRRMLEPLGEYHYVFPSATWGLVLYSAVLVLAFDFGLYLAHYLEHRIPFLWEFHKVHHSAAVLTPFTVYRQHPMDDFLSVVFSSLTMGTVDGLFRYVFPSGCGIITVFQMNVFTFLFYFFGYNLRHSHVWLSYGKFWSSIFISPAQHQIHHSTAPKHFDKNIGFFFAIWDKMFGTLYIPQHKENLEFGLSHEDTEALNSVVRLYTVPFVKSFRLLRRNKSK